MTRDDAPPSIVGTRPAWATDDEHVLAWGPFAIDYLDGHDVGVALRLHGDELAWSNADRLRALPMRRLEATADRLIGETTEGERVTVRSLVADDRAWLLPTPPPGADVIAFARARWGWGGFGAGRQRF